MKTSINTKSLANAVPQDAVTQSAIKARESQSSYVRKSFSLYSNEVEYVDALAVSLGQSRGKTMSASEALRVIINAHKDAKS